MSAVSRLVRYATPLIVLAAAAGGFLLTSFVLGSREHLDSFALIVGAGCQLLAVGSITATLRALEKDRQKRWLRTHFLQASLLYVLAAFFIAIRMVADMSSAAAYYATAAIVAFLSNALVLFLMRNIQRSGAA